MFKKSKYVAIDVTEFDYIDKCEEYESKFLISSIVPELSVNCSQIPTEFEDIYDLFTYDDNNISIDLKMHSIVEYIRIRDKKDMGKIKSALPKLNYPEDLLQKILDVENLEHFTYPDVLMFVIYSYKDDRGVNVERKVISYNDYKEDYMEFFKSFDSSIRRFDKKNESKKQTSKKKEKDVLEDGYAEL